jgi:L-ascorbate metabolism protein UlaG (beta-lactamase superfamily)
MKITWIGHSALLIAGSKSIVVDPFISGNPVSKINIKDILHVDIVVVTHDHMDHIGDALQLCINHKAVFVSIYEIAEEFRKSGIKSEAVNVGGTVVISNVSISLVPALHTGTLGGTAVGVIIEMDKKTVYHSGDTGLSLEMILIGEMYHPDIAFLPIDGRYTMTPRLAAKAVELLKVPKVVPIHYNTFDNNSALPVDFERFVGNACDVIILKPGESLEL